MSRPDTPLIPARRPAPAPPPAPAGPASAGQVPADRLALLDRPLTSYYLLIGGTALLLVFGLTMVLSSSIIESMARTGSPYTWFQQQFLWVVVGLPLMWAASRLPVRVYRAVGYPLLALAVAGLAVVLVVGVSFNGATRWIDAGPIQLQPSELAKLAMVLWGADLLARRQEYGGFTEWRHFLIPLMPGVAVVALLVMMGSDLGTTFIIFTIFLALLWVAGAPLRIFAGILALVAFVVAVLIVVQPYRLERVSSFMSPESDPLYSGWQAIHGKFAIASGGWFGVGIGAGREKWQWLPHAESDFIFAIIGEEFGLIGTLLVVSLFGLLGYAGLRVAARVGDPFMRLAAAGATAWITVQAMVNIGAVIGVLPITGIPLPLVSKGGSALLPTMIALGMLMSFAKHEPGARRALAARGPGPVRGTLSWLGLGSGRGS